MGLKCSNLESGVAVTMSDRQRQKGLAELAQSELSRFSSRMRELDEECVVSDPQGVLDELATLEAEQRQAVVRIMDYLMNRPSLNRRDEAMLEDLAESVAWADQTERVIRGRIASEDVRFDQAAYEANKAAVIDGVHNRSKASKRGRISDVT